MENHLPPKELIAFPNRCNISIHAINCLDKNKHRSFLFKTSKNMVKTTLAIHTIMLERDLSRSSAQSHAIVSTGMNKLIVNNNISNLRQTAHDAHISVKARIEK
ncbi:hypothetical protein FPSE5266_20283 [Fusarium pseudograminearum]|nr:hypothetical protein FPSE5266_20283 [Fusarium pseudograminearum]